MSNPWSNFEISPMGLCEEPIDAWIRTPANTWSNLFFIFVGIFLFLRYKKQIRKSQILKLIPVSAIIVGSASFIYHASYSFELLIIDFIATWLPISFVAVVNLDRLFGLRKKIFWSLYLTLIFVPSIPAILLRGPLIPVLSIVFYILMVLLEIPIRKIRNDISTYKYFSLMLLCQFFAAFFWVLDQQGIICDPQNHFFQGHALWHGFNALGIYFLFKHYELYFTVKSA